MSRAIKTNGGDFSPTAKLGVLIAHYMKDQYHGVFYGRAQNLSRHLTQVYDAVFGSYDLVLMPTTPQTAHAAAVARSRPQDAHRPGAQHGLQHGGLRPDGASVDLGAGR